jgi:hypothetical protein
VGYQCSFFYNSLSKRSRGAPFCSENAKIAAGYLNVITMSAMEQESTKEMESLREEVKQLKGQFELFSKGKFMSD